MSAISIDNFGFTGFTVIPTLFIDKYLCSANDAQIKVYLFLMRLVNAESRANTDITSIAEQFNHTERDVERALKYWESKNLLSLEYDDSNRLKAIHFKLPAEQPSEPVNSADTSDECTPAAPSKVLKTAVREPNYSVEQLAFFKTQADIKQILFVAETYLKRTLTVTDIKLLIYFYDELNFPFSLVDYLIDYCVDNQKTHINYIKAVAFEWSDKGIQTVEAAKQYTANSKYSNEMFWNIHKELGLFGMITPMETEYYDKWLNELNFSWNMIEAACRQSLKYSLSKRPEKTDEILNGWHKSGILRIEDIPAEETRQKGERAPAKTKYVPKPNKFTDYPQNDYDFDELERTLLSN